MRVTLLVSHEPLRALALARAWVAAGESVTAVLLDAATALTRPGHVDHQALLAAAESGVTLLAHTDGLRRRREPADTVVATADLDDVAELVGGGADKVVWW